jgi:hypothetical protein
MEALEPEKTSAWESHSAVQHHQAPHASVLIGRGKGRQSPDVEGCSDDEMSDERREWFAHREQKSKEFGVDIGVDLEDETVPCDCQDGGGTVEDRKVVGSQQTHTSSGAIKVKTEREKLEEDLAQYVQGLKSRSDDRGEVRSSS